MEYMTRPTRSDESIGSKHAKHGPMRAARRRWILAAISGVVAISIAQGCAAVVGGAAGAGAGYIAGHEAADDD